MKTSTTQPMDWFILVVSATCTAFLVGWVIWYCSYGFDFTDEGFYLNWISNPYIYSTSVTQFGFIYHPVYLLFNGDISSLRVFNILVLYFLAWLFSYILLKALSGNDSLETVPRLIISGGVATGFFLILTLWQPTPNYNSLALKALLVNAIGLLLADRKVTAVGIIGVIIIGAGWWLAFMAKPTVAVGLGLSTIFYLVVSGKASYYNLSIPTGAAICLIILSALSIDGSLIVFFNRLADGADLAMLLGSKHTINQSLRLDDFQLNDGLRSLIIIGALAVFVVVHIFQKESRIFTFFKVIISVTLLVAVLAIIFRFIQIIDPFDRFQGLVVWTFPLASIFLVLLSYRGRNNFNISPPMWALIIIFCVLPFIFAFGTISNYWVVGARAGMFWVLAGFVMLSTMSSSKRIIVVQLPFVFGIQIITVVLISTAIGSPYRQAQPLYENTAETYIRNSVHPIRLSNDFAKYLSGAQLAAREAGFNRGMPMLDLSGQSPGILYAISAVSLGQAWAIGGYPGSEKLTTASLNLVSCEELSIAWLLIEPEGPRKISSEVISSFGADIIQDFEVAGVLKTAAGAGGFKKPRHQKIMRPVRDVDTAISACISARINKA